MSSKKRLYQVAKEFYMSNETLIEFLQKHKFKVRNHMVPITDEMLELVTKHFVKKEEEGEKAPDFRKKLQDKKAEEEARREAIRHEIDEVLEHTKGDTFEPVKIVRKPEVKVEKPSKPVKKAKTEIIEIEAGKTAPVEMKPASPETVADHVQIHPEFKEKIPAEFAVKSVQKEEPAIVKVREPISTASEDESRGKPKRHLKKHLVARSTDTQGQGFDKEGRPRKRHKKRHRDLDETEAGLSLPLTPKKKKRRRKKPATPIDERAIEASIRETLAKMSEPTKKRRHKKEKESEEILEEESNVIHPTEFTSVSELANMMHVEPSEVIQACISLGLLVTINQRLEKDTILMVADEFDYDVKFLTEYGEERLEEMVEEEDDPSLLQYRPPVVTVMGHVDHGKTSLLDYIRESNIIAGESGGITQHIGAYEVSFKSKKITFLDTPGHQAFTAMRARGAQVTDIVVLVVAADDSVMPQTIEAINHARAAGVPIIVAINKMDKPTANPDMIKKQLSEHNVLVEEWGGKSQCAEISAKTGQGIDRLLELILLEAEFLELKANPSGNAKGVLIEARMDKGRGTVGTVLIQKGTLKIGDIFVAGQYSGRVRALFNEREHAVKDSPPSTPVQVLGFNGMPQAGDIMSIVDSEQEAKEISLKRQQLKREQSFRQIKRLTLDAISKQIAEGAVKELSIIIKADVDGSMEALSDSLMQLATEDVTVRIIHKSVGAISESDVLLAQASDAVILGFHVKPNSLARELARREKIDIRLYKVIYDVVNDIKLALAGLLEPEITEEVIGTVEIREIFKASKVGIIAGCTVQTGKATRNSMARLIREGKVVHEGKISSLKRFKDDVREVTSGYECGLTLDTFKDIQVGDLIEVYQLIETARTL